MRSREALQGRAPLLAGLLVSMAALNACKPETKAAVADTRSRIQYLSVGEDLIVAGECIQTDGTTSVIITASGDKGPKGDNDTKNEDGSVTVARIPLHPDIVNEIGCGHIAIENADSVCLQMNGVKCGTTISIEINPEDTEEIRERLREELNVDKLMDELEDSIEDMVPDETYDGTPDDKECDVLPPPPVGTRA